MGGTQTASRSFAAHAASVPEARHFVSSVLAGSGQQQWLDEAELAVSELATNAVLHAHSPFEVVVQAHPDGVYVQVWDDDPALPQRRDSDASSTTGRGLELVAAIATFHGVQAVGPTKVVWFSLGMPRPDGAADLLLDRWTDRAEEPSPEHVADGRSVLLAGMPVAVWMAAREHHNALMREFTLQQSAVADEDGALDRLVLADRARSLVLAALRAAGPGDALDLALRVRPEQAAWFEALRDVLDRAEELTRSGELLAAPGPQIILEVRRWACRQVLEQLDGAAPEPWRGPRTMP